MTPPILSTGTTKEHARRLPPVVLVHGIFRNGRQMRRLRAMFAAAGRRTLAPDLEPNDGSASITALAKQLGKYLEDKLGASEQCDIIGHSMGGMVARAYIQRHGGQARVRRFVTLGAPHQGSLLAWFWPGLGARDLRPGSPFLRDLDRDVHLLEGVHVASLWTPFDLIIVPPRSSAFPFGHNLPVAVPHHRSLITDKRIARTVIGLLGEGEPVLKVPKRLVTFSVRRRGK